MSRDTERKRAKALKAVDARDLIQASLPFVLPHMTAPQVDQVQRVLDAAVVNPAVQKEVEELNRKSIRSQSGDLIHRDPDIVSRAHKAEENYIRIKEADKHVRLDFEKLLAPEALKPTTDNPDEAAYLIGVKATLVSEGVWLRVNFKWGVKDPDEPTRNIASDGKTFEVWLSLGFAGDTMPTKSGRLTRDALLETSILGTGYYEYVHNGPFEKLLTKAIDGLASSIETGRHQHWAIARGRSLGADYVVSRVSDFLGGADYPDEEIWDPPHQIAVRARYLKADGNVVESSKLVIIAALMTEIAAKALRDYIVATTLGAERALTVLTILKYAGKVAEVFLFIRTLAQGLVRLLAGKATTTGAGTATRAIEGKPQLQLPAGQGAPNVTRRPEAFADTNLAVGKEVYARTVVKATESVTINTTGAGTAFNAYDVAAQVENARRLEEWRRGFRALELSNATLDEKLAFIRRNLAKYYEGGHPP